MSLSDALSIQDKLSLLNNLRSSFARDIIRLCLEMGVDYDTFNYAEYSAPETPVMHQEKLLETACNGLKLAEQKLEELQ